MGVSNEFIQTNKRSKVMFDKSKPFIKALRTFLQAVVGITTFILGLLAIPGVADYLSNNPALANISLATIIAVFTYLQNAIEDFIKTLRN